MHSSMIGLGRVSCSVSTPWQLALIATSALLGLGDVHLLTATQQLWHT
jgi:hypothetical protein